MLTLMGIDEENPLRPVTPSAKTRRVGEHFDSENRVVMDWSSLKAEAVKLATSSFLRVFVVVGSRQKWQSQSLVVLEFLGVVFQREPTLSRAGRFKLKAEKFWFKRRLG